MTKRELIEALAGVPDDTLVVLSSDAEGNSHSPLSGVYDSHYVADTSWSGRLVELDDEEDCDEFSEEELETAVPCILLSPVN